MENKSKELTPLAYISNELERRKNKNAFVLLYSKKLHYQYKALNMKKVFSILIPVLICFSIGAAASYFQSDAISTWYPTLNKPSLTPPNTIFPLAWGFIYLCSGISFGLIILSDNIRKKIIVPLFTAQLFFNFIWSILFFYFRNPLLGFIDILVLDVFVLFYIIKTYPINKASSLLFLPYILWILFATYLN